MSVEELKVLVMICDSNELQDDVCRVCGNKEILSEIIKLDQSKNWFCSKCSILYIRSQIEWNKQQNMTFNKNPKYNVYVSNAK